MKDVLFGYDSDLHFENGDLMLTNSGTDFIEREIYKLLITERGEWKTNLRLGASPVIFAGQPNTKETAKALEKYLFESLNLTIAPANAKIKVTPIDYTSVIIFIDIYTPDALEISIPFSFDYTNGISKLDRGDPRLVTPETGDYEVNDINNLKQPNKYWSRLSSRSANSFL